MSFLSYLNLYESWGQIAELVIVRHPGAELRVLIKNPTV